MADSSFYVSSTYGRGGKVTGKAKTADLVHFDIFAWKDSNAKNRIESNLQRDALAAMASRFNNTVPKNLKSFWILKSEEMTYRFSESVAKECAAYVRQAIMTDKYGNNVAPLTKSWLKKKRYIQGKRARWDEHVGVVFGDMARAVDYFRSNQRSAGETKHTGYMVGIRGDATGAVFSPRGKRIKTKAYESTKMRRNNTTGKMEETTRILSKKAKLLTRGGRDGGDAEYTNTASPANKLAWLERGANKTKGDKVIGKQVPRPIFSMAIHDFLIEYGFEVGSTTVLKDGVKKTPCKKGSKVERAFKEFGKKALEADSHVRFDFRNDR